MMITTKGRYALRVMLDLAEHYGKAYIPLKDIAEKFQVVATDRTDDLRELASVAFKSLKAGWEEAKKTFNQERK